MSVTAGVVINGRHQEIWCGAFAEGMRRHGVHVRRLHRSDYSFDVDVLLVWSIRNRGMIRRQQQAGRDYLVLELPYWGARNAQALHMASVGWNGLNGRADFNNQGMPGNRWARYGVEVQPWKADGEYALLIGQCMGDMSHAHADIEKFYRRMADTWAAPLYFRHHPLGKWEGIRKTSIKALGGSLSEALDGARVVVTFNSNAGVDAAMAGVPVYAGDEGSMAWPVASHACNDIIRPDRTQWLHDLAYCQWTLDEMASGEAWEHLKRGTSYD